jgi:hypothetical protein
MLPSDYAALAKSVVTSPVPRSYVRQNSYDPCVGTSQGSLRANVGFHQPEPHAISQSPHHGQVDKVNRIRLLSSSTSEPLAASV